MSNELPPTHRCRICGALWRINPADKSYPSGHPFHEESWTWLGAPPPLGKCCDNREMGNQIEKIRKDGN